MLSRKLLYFSSLAFFLSPYVFAGSLQNKKNIFSTNVNLYDISKIDTYFDSNSKNLTAFDSFLESHNFNYQIDQKLFEFTKVSQFHQDSIIKSSNDSLKRNSKKFVKWNFIERNDSLPSDVKWVPIDSYDIVPFDVKWNPIDNKSYPIYERNKGSRLERNLKLKNENVFDFKLLKIGSVVPTSETLTKGEIRFSVGQVSPTASGYAKGTGNQNYSGVIDYGFRNNLLLSFFYTDADDPLTKRIVSRDTQPENRWSSYGSSIKWKFLEKPKLKIAIEGALENWMVQSGGCAGNDCRLNTSNIFNSNTSMVENNNLVGSVALPIGLKYSSNLDFTISPKLTFLPESQSNQYGKGDFYGNNVGIGFGLAYKVINRLKAFSSYYFPIGDSKNTFDAELNYSNTSIYTLGMNYSIDSRTNFQAFLSNGFGLTPATSVLSIPSSDETLYGFNITYTPNKLDNYYDLEDERSSSRVFLNGLSVSNNSYINAYDSQLNILYDSNGSWYSRYEKSLSQRFIVDITFGGIDEGIETNSSFKQYFSPGNTILRGGAKAILYSNRDGNITSSLRGSFGRVLAEDKHGYFFSESINTYNLFDNVSFNVNPKIGFTGTGESSGLGTGVHWKVLKQFTLISETNIPINNADNNVTFGIRYSPEESYKHIDLYSSNAFSFIDIGQLMKRKNNVLGVNLGIVF